MTDHDLSKFSTEELEFELFYRKQKFTFDEARECLKEAFEYMLQEYGVYNKAGQTIRYRKTLEGLLKCFDTNMSPSDVFPKE